MNSTLKYLAPFVAAVALTASTASASLIAYDGFDGGTVFNGGTGWSGDWTSGIFSGSNLTFGDLTTTGAGAGIDGYWNGQSTRALATAQTTGTVWISWIQNSGGTTTDNPNQIRVMNGGDNAFVVGQHFDANTFKLYNGNGDFSAGGDSGVAITGTHFVALSINLADNIISLYIDPTGLGAGGAPSSAANAVWDRSGSLSSISGFQSVGGGDSFAWDEVRVGTTWADVSPTAVPEPASFAALAGLAILGFATTRRRAVR